jgi:beta-lactamase regulating signal transducer with metallopeptidase domain
MRCLRSWLQCVSRLQSFQCYQVRSKRERHLPFAARFAGNIGPRINSLDTGSTSNFVTDGIPVSFGDNHPSPAVRGVLSPRILLPTGIDRLLSQREFRAVLIHELAHARRHDNLIRLLYEVSLCVLWFHPLVWPAGARIALYRELSCDESVVRRFHGPALVSALAKLAVCE